MRQPATWQSRCFLRSCRKLGFTLGLDQARVVHPDEVRTEDPRAREHVKSAENHTLNVQPDKAWQCFEYFVMYLDTARGPDRQKPSKQANKVGDFSADDAQPSVPFQRQHNGFLLSLRQPTLGVQLAF